MKKHFYLSCTGQVYCSLELIDGYDEPCPMCGDSDEYFGYFETEDEAWESYVQNLYGVWEG